MRLVKLKTRTKVETVFVEVVIPLLIIGLLVAALGVGAWVAGPS